VTAAWSRRPREARREADVKAVTWRGKRDVRVEEVPDPKVEE
jgi:hypothetical protein